MPSQRTCPACYLSTKIADLLEIAVPCLCPLEFKPRVMDGWLAHLPYFFLGNPKVIQPGTSTDAAMQGTNMYFFKNKAVGSKPPYPNRLRIIIVQCWMLQAQKVIPVAQKEGEKRVKQAGCCSA